MRPIVAGAAWLFQAVTTNPLELHDAAGKVMRDAGSAAGIISLRNALGSEVKVAHTAAGSTRGRVVRRVRQVVANLMAAFGGGDSVYYDSYWESLSFTPAERDAWRAAFPPEGPDGFEIAPRAARRWADAGFSPEQARSTFEAAGVDHMAARCWKWAEPNEALAWRAAGFGPEDGDDWALSFSPDEAVAWRGAGFGPAEAAGWVHLMGRDGVETAQAWAAAGFDRDEAARAMAEGVPLEVVRLQRPGPDAPLGRGNGGQRRPR